MNRSEELCKLLGIKPIIAMCRNGRNCDDAVADCLNCEKRDSKVREVYPDLTKPSNFVKLLEDIKVDGIYLGDWLVTYYGYFTNRDSYIENLVSTLKDERKYYLKNDIQQIKQQAQATKWDY